VNMRSVLLAAAALTLSAGVFAQTPEAPLPKCMRDAPPVNVDVKDVAVAKVLPFLGASCGVEIRVEGIEGTEAARQVPAIRFQQAKVADVFLFMVRSFGLKYSVLDDRTILVTKQ
jgi:hypothetical protein